MMERTVFLFLSISMQEMTAKFRALTRLKKKIFRNRTKTEIIVRIISKEVILLPPYLQEECREA